MNRQGLLVFVFLSLMVVSTNTAIALQSNSDMEGLSIGPGSLSMDFSTPCEMANAKSPLIHEGGVVANEHSVAQRLSRWINDMSPSEIDAMNEELDPTHRLPLSARILKATPAEELATQLALYPKYLDLFGTPQERVPGAKPIPCKVFDLRDPPCAYGVGCSGSCTEDDGTVGTCMTAVDVNNQVPGCDDLGGERTYRCQSTCPMPGLLLLVAILTSSFAFVLIGHVPARI